MSEETNTQRRRRENLSARSRLEADRIISERGLPEPGDKCGDYGGKTKGGGVCTAPAGLDTPHRGAGLCWAHGGLRRDELAIGAWVMGHALAKGIEISPWDALLGEVRRTAGEVAWLDWKVAQAPTDDDLLDSFRPWVEMRNKQRLWLGRVSKMAIDAGVAQIMVQQVQLEVQTMGRVLGAALDALGLTESQEEIARAAFRRELLAVEAEQTGVQPVPGSNNSKEGLDV